MEEPNNDDVSASTSQGSVRSWFGRDRDEPGTDLRKRVKELEETVAELRQRKDIAELDEVELTELASQTAIAMVRSSRDRQDEAVLFAEEVISEARCEADDLRKQSENGAAEPLDNAQREADEIQKDAEHKAQQLTVTVTAAAEQTLRLAQDEARELEESTAKMAESRHAEADRKLAEATEQAEIIRSDAQEYAGSLQTEADGIRAAAEDAATVIKQRVESDAQRMRDEAETLVDRARERAKAEAEYITSEATSRRDELLTILAERRRWVCELLLNDVEAVRASAVAAFSEVRTTLDNTLGKMVGPSAQAEDLLARFDLESERLEAMSDLNQPPSDDGDNDANVQASNDNIIRIDGRPDLDETVDEVLEDPAKPDSRE